MSQTYPFPWPSEGDRFFESDASFHVMGDMQQSITAGFKDAGDAIVESFRQSRFSNRDLLFPLMYCYRQYLELKMKLVISRIKYRAGLEADEYMNYKAMGGHNIVTLWRTMEHTTENFVGRDVNVTASEKIGFDQVRSCIEELNQIDPEGDGFRYPDTKTTTALHEIDPFHIKRMIEDIASYLDAFHDYCTAGEG